MKLLRIHLYQPSANYRVPFAMRRWITYPIPPYSTVVGFLCNFLEDSLVKEFVRSEFHLAVFGRWKGISYEYTWHRNLSPKSHKERFGSERNRTYNGIVEHPGGQAPRTIDTLNDVEVFVYVYGEDKYIERIKDNMKEGKFYRDTPHLGRAEDVVVFKEVKTLELSELKIKPVLTGPGFFSWVPEPLAVKCCGEKRENDDVENGDTEPQNIDEPCRTNLWRNYIASLDDGNYGLSNSIKKYRSLFQKLYGNIIPVTSTYEVKNGVRVFNHIRAKLWEGKSFPFTDELSSFRMLCDSPEVLKNELCKSDSQKRNSPCNLEVCFPMWLVKIK